MLDYLIGHRGIYGLERDDTASLQVVRRYRSHGLTHLVLEQTAEDIPLLDGEVHAAVADDGRLVNVLGAPLPNPARGGSPAPRLDPKAALRASGRGFRPWLAPATGGSAAWPGRGGRAESRYRGGRGTHLVFVGVAGRQQLAWRQLATGPDGGLYDVVSDAATGKFLRSRTLTHHADALVHQYYPGAPVPAPN